jgi:hypothetical protein
MADFAGHVALFVGQEEPQVAVAADQALLLEAGKAFLDLALERQLVGIDWSLTQSVARLSTLGLTMSGM